MAGLGVRPARRPENSGRLAAAKNIPLPLRVFIQARVMAAATATFRRW
jgi:hypothetical protein